MKCISILQPWASLVVTKDPKTGKAYKQIETRSWNTKHRGPLLIHASKRWDRELNDTVGKIGADGILKIHGYHSEGIRNGKLITNLPLGAIIGMVNVVDTFPMETAGNVFQKMSDIGIKDQDQELAFGDYSADRYGWLLSDPIMFKNPIPCKGSLSIWNLPVELEGAVLAEIIHATGKNYEFRDGKLFQVASQYQPTIIATPGEGAVIVEAAEKSIGQILTEAFTLNELKSEVVEMELGFPAGIITKLMNDEYYTNNVPVVLFKNLILSLHIRPSDVYKSMIPTFNAVLAKETPETIKKKPHGYQLWENKEAVKKYTAHLKELIENPESKLHLPSRGVDGHDTNKAMWDDFLKK